MPIRRMLVEVGLGRKPALERTLNATKVWQWLDRETPEQRWWRRKSPRFQAMWTLMFFAALATGLTLLVAFTTGDASRGLTAGLPFLAMGVAQAVRKLRAPARPLDAGGQ